MPALDGVYTALVTPFRADGQVDEELFGSLLDLQSESGVRGVVIGGTTGESPTLEVPELRRLTELARDRLPGRLDVIAGTGRNRLSTTLELTGWAADLGLSTVMLVDPYYNAPSSLEIRREYLEPVAAHYPSLGLLPYVIPSRTGTRLDPVDLEALCRSGRRIVGVKDATGDDRFGDEVRALCPTISILAGDDSRTLGMIERSTIRADGVVSVISNLIPREVVRMVELARSGDRGAARAAAAPLAPIFDRVTIRSTEAAPGDRPVEVRSRNPVPIKAAMTLLGARVGRARPPLGRLGPEGLRQLVEVLRALDRNRPEALQPFLQRFGGRIEGLDDRTLQREVAYDAW